MRALAEYAMRGRRQAVLAAFLSGLIPLVNTVLSPALVGLIILRHGWQEGLKVLVWAVLPAIAWAVIGDFAHIVVLLGVSALAVVLRETGSWQLTLLASMLVGVFAELMLKLNPAFVEALQQQLTVMMNSAEMQAQMGGQEIPDMGILLSSLFGVMSMTLSLTLLMLARWWQAQLYNPGGFGREFRQLRLSYKTSSVLLLMFLLASVGTPVLQGWIMYFLLPLFFAGLALVHGVVEIRQIPRFWLIMFYLLLLSPMLVQLVTLAAVIDSWYDFRARLGGGNHGNKPNNE